MQSKYLLESIAASHNEDIIYLPEQLMVRELFNIGAVKGKEIGESGLIDKYVIMPNKMVAAGQIAGIGKIAVYSEAQHPKAGTRTGHLVMLFTRPNSNLLVATHYDFIAGKINSYQKRRGNLGELLEVETPCNTCADHIGMLKDALKGAVNREKGVALLEQWARSRNQYTPDHQEEAVENRKTYKLVK